MAVTSTMTALGTVAPAFSLPDCRGGTASREDFSQAPALLVIFMCNHCPYVKHVQKPLATLVKEYQDKGVAVVGISSNDISSHPDDGPEAMAKVAREIGYTFPYLYDESQEVAKAYKAACTPDFFLYDAKRKLVYRGQMDGSRPGNNIPVTGSDSAGPWTRSWQASRFPGNSGQALDAGSSGSAPPARSVDIPGIPHHYGGANEAAIILGERPLPKTSTHKADHLKRLRDAVRNVLAFDSALRPPASDGGPGGSIEFPAKEKREFIIIGDLHGNHKNLRAILDHEKNLQKVEQNKAVLLFLGDAVHNDRSGFTYEMDSSIEIMDIILGLINDYPQNVIYLLGNHDSFEPELSKMGIQQGLLYRDALIYARGKQYVRHAGFLRGAAAVHHPQALPGRPCRTAAGRADAHGAGERPAFPEPAGS